MQQKLAKLESAFSTDKCIYVAKNNEDIISHDVCAQIKIKVNKSKILVEQQNEVLFEILINEKTYNKLVVLYYLYKYTKIFIFMKRIVLLIIKIIKNV